MSRRKKRKHYFPRCCGTTMEIVHDHNKKGELFLSHLKCKDCERKLFVR
jgi:hypothetical protein